MGYQVFPQPSGGTEFENFGINIAQSIDTVPDFTDTTVTDGYFNITSTMTAGIYQSYSNVFGATAAVRINSVVTTVETSGTLINVSTTQSSFQVQSKMNWSQEVSSAPFATSTAAVNWNNLVQTPNDTRPLVVAGGYASTNTPQLSYSTNGVSWTNRIVSPNTSSASQGQQAWHDGTNFFFIPQTDNSGVGLWWSTNGGVNWTTRTNLIDQTGGNPNLANIKTAYYDTVFARHYFSQEQTQPFNLWTSTNGGVTWTTMSNGQTAYPTVTFVRIGDRLYTGDSEIGRLTFTTNGVNWNVCTTPATAGGIFGITYSTANGRYVAVTNRGATIHSTDGINWTTGSKMPQSSFWAPGYNAVGYVDGWYVAAGGRGDRVDAVIASTDGINWVNSGQTSGISNSSATFDIYFGCVYGSTTRSAKWIWYSQSVPNGIPNAKYADAATGRKIKYHNNFSGLTRSAIKIIMNRFRQSKNIV